MLLAFGCGGSDEAPAETFKPTSIALRADGDFLVNKADPLAPTTIQLHTIGSLQGHADQELTSGVVYSSSNEAVATVDDKGLVTVLAGGPVALHASFGSLEATFEARATCAYPKYPADIISGQTMPPFAWPAKWPDGRPLKLDLANVYCDAEWSDVKTIAFDFSAGWCGPCTAYAKSLESRFEALNALGMQVVIMEVETNTPGQLADLNFAYDHLDEITTRIPAIAIGDKDTEPKSGFVQGSSIIEFFPTIVVVRTSDMKIIADSHHFTNVYPPLEEIAADPDADWSNPITPPFVNNCEPEADEAGEPNDVPSQATPIGVGEFSGGICTDAPDLYQVDVEGPWTVTLDFANATGNLDLFIWDAEGNKPLQVEGQATASQNDTNQEKLQFSGPAMVAVKAFQGASAPYTLTLTAD